MPDSQIPRMGFVGEAYYTDETGEAALLEELGFRVVLLDKPGPNGRFYFKVSGGPNTAGLTLPDAVRGIYQPHLWAASEAVKVQFYQSVTKRLRAWTAAVNAKRAERSQQ